MINQIRLNELLLYIESIKKNVMLKKEKEISVLYFTGKEHLGSLTTTLYDEPDFVFFIFPFYVAICIHYLHI